MTEGNRVSLCYGRGEMTLCLPPDAHATVIRKPQMPVLNEPGWAVRDALDHPIGEDGKRIPGLKDQVKSASSACIAICDITRPVPNHLFLRPMIEDLMAGGLSPRDITVLVATGLHRANEGDELLELVGDPWVLREVSVVNHDALCDADHVDLGRTPTRGTPVRINRCFVEADLRIATGLVEPHFMAGYSGGRKVIAPGLAHAETIRTFHNHDFMSNPAADNCNLDANPLHEEQLQIVEMIGGAWALNTVIDEQRRLSHVCFGEIIASHADAVTFIQSRCRVGVTEPFDIVVTSAAGHPLDKTYYQAVKGMVGAIGILKPGGHLFAVAECSEGLGSTHYRDAQQRLRQNGIEGFLDGLSRKTLADIDEWQTQMQTKAMRAGEISVLSKLSPEDQAVTCVKGFGDRRAFEEAIFRAWKSCDDPRIAVIPEGPYVIPFVESAG